MQPKEKGTVPVPVPEKWFSFSVRSTVSFFVEYDVRKQGSNTLGMAQA